MISKLSPEHLKLIFAIVDKTQPELADHVRRDLSMWDQAVRTRVAELVGDEVVQQGFDKDYAPNAEGLRLLEIVDLLEG